MSPVDQARLIQGAPLLLGAKVYVCPALNIKLMRVFSDQLKLIQGGMQLSSAETDDGKKDEYLAALVTVVTAALKRNYEDVTEDLVEDGIDLNNLKDVALAVLGASGFKTSDQLSAEKIVYSSSGELTGTA